MAVAAEVLHGESHSGLLLLDRGSLVKLLAALDVGGMEAKFIWGNQWVKLLELLYEGATIGVGRAVGKLLGRQTPEGKAARARTTSDRTHHEGHELAMRLAGLLCAQSTIYSSTDCG